MSLQHASSWRRLAITGLLATLTIAGFSCDGAEARTTHHHPQAVHQVADKRVVHGPKYHPPYSAIVIDNNSGQLLHDENADDLRHPASLTKIMTLYLLFEQLEAGSLKLNTQLRVSAFAALQPPTKLGLKANQTLAVEDAIKGLVTESANDAAVVVAEAIAGSEAEFATLMTQKARALGMMSTTYVNASGLPADEQITTARDQGLLGCTIQDHFPTTIAIFPRQAFAITAWKCTITTPCLVSWRASTASRPATPKPLGTTWSLQFVAKRNISWLSCWAEPRGSSVTFGCAS